MLVLVNDTDRNDISMLYQSITDSINECVSVLISDAYNPIRKMVIHIYEKLREMARKLILLLKPALIDFEITLSKIQHQTYTNINTIRGPHQTYTNINTIRGPPQSFKKDFCNILVQIFTSNIFQLVLEFMFPDICWDVVFIAIELLMFIRLFLIRYL